jgi:dienelactone hydrolase
LSPILTPISLWKDFDDSLETSPQALGEKTQDGIKYEYYNFLGRQTGRGRVNIFGVLATKEGATARDALLVMPDSTLTVDERTIKFFVNHGYSVLMVDYRGKWADTENYTVYPDDVIYANTQFCGRHKDFVDESADKTSWYEWVAVGIYARKFLIEKLDVQNVGVVGIRDGGEIVWKLACAAQFSCAVTVCAAGWKSYAGYGKFGGNDPQLNEERYRFLAGIDSQAYAPYVKCPVIMLCSTNDPNYDYDRAYDTFARINPEFIDKSVISYSVKSNACIGLKSTTDMFMFLDSYVKQRQVFIPKPAEITITVDEDTNLVAKTNFDDMGIPLNFGLYMAEDCKDSSLRDWVDAPYKCKLSGHEHEFYLNVYEKTAMIFALCYVTYSNGFTVWSRIAVKKISGKFRNSQPKCNVLYSSKNGEDCFSVADYENYSVGGTFLLSNEILPKVVTKEKGLKGIYSVCGLSTYRLNSPKYSPDKDGVLKFDVCADADTALNLTMRDVTSGEIYTYKVNILGGVWQSVILESKYFKNQNGAALSDFAKGLLFTISGKEPYAVNNFLWL